MKYHKGPWAGRFVTYNLRNIREKSNETWNRNVRRS